MTEIIIDTTNLYTLARMDGGSGLALLQSWALSGVTLVIPDMVQAEIRYAQGQGYQDAEDALTWLSNNHNIITVRETDVFTNLNWDGISPLPRNLGEMSIDELNAVPPESDRVILSDDNSWYGDDIFNPKKYLGDNTSRTTTDYLIKNLFDQGFLDKFEYAILRDKLVATDRMEVSHKYLNSEIYLYTKVDFITNELVYYDDQGSESRIIFDRDSPHYRPDAVGRLYEGALSDARDGIFGKLNTRESLIGILTSFITSEDGSLNLQEAQDLATSLISRLYGVIDHPHFEASIKSGILAGLGSGIADIGDAVNALYEPFKNGIATGDWSGFGAAVATYGFITVTNSLAIAGTIAAVGTVLGPPSAAVLGTMVLGVGLVGGVAAIIELGNKIYADLEAFVTSNELPVDEALIKAALIEIFDRSANPNFDMKDIIDRLQTFSNQSGLSHVVVDDKGAYDTEHGTMVVATPDSDTIYGSAQNEVIYAGAGDDVIIGGLGRDIIVGGSGSDTFIDSVTASADGRQNENDIYFGGSEYAGTLANFLNWLTNGTETDVVRYTVASGKADDPTTPENEAALQLEGLTVTGLEIATLGTREVVKITVQDQATGVSGTDLLFGIEKVELSERPDSFRVTESSLDTAIIIDMGTSGRVQSELPPGETLTHNAFTTKVDVVDYSGINNGLIYINGVVADHSEVSLDSVFTTDGLTEELTAIADYASGGLIGTNHKLRVESADKVILTDHDDVLISAQYGSIVYTGEGQDKIYFQNGVAIGDLSADDRISLMGVFTLYGGLKNGWSESPWAWGPYGTAYGLNPQGELVISNVFWQVMSEDENGNPKMEAATTYVLNFQDTLRDVAGGGQIGAGNIFLLEYKLSTVLFRDMTQDQIGKASAVGAGAFDLLGYHMKIMTGTSMFGGEDPLVLDLDGDGIELTSLDRAKSHFDIDGDLYAEATGFVGKDDGVLARDINGNGKIDSTDEMFGQGNTSGFEVLKLLDGNQDGVVDANDNGLADFNGDGVVDAEDDFNDLQIWQDLDEDHVTDTGELKSVSEWNITSFAVPTTIAAPGTVENPTVINGNTITQTATYTKGDGSSHMVADVTFRVENQTSVYVGAPITISETVEDLPDLKGYGTLVSLHEAMSVRPDSETEVRAALSTLDTPSLADLRGSIFPILEAWAKGSPIKIDGVVQTGTIAETDYDNMVYIRNADGSILDYATVTEVLDVGGSVSYNIHFASFVSMRVTLAGGGTGLTESDAQAAIRSLLNDMFAESGSFDPSGENSRFFQNAAGAVEFGAMYDSGWAGGVVLDMDHELPAGATFSGVSNLEFSFYERLIGESLEPFFEEPDDPFAGNVALEMLLERMETILNLFAVRLAVQDSPLSGYFETIDYNVASDGFSSAGEARISDVFHALLVDAEIDADPVTWLAAWKPFMDVFFSDYSRGNGNLPVSYGYLVQQMMNAVEREPGGISVLDFADAFNIPADLVQVGTGTIVGRNIEDIILIDGDETRVEGQGGADNYVIGKDFNSVEIFDKDGALAESHDILRFSEHAAEDIIATREGIDLVLTDAATGETIRIIDQFEGRWPGPTISDASFDTGVAEIIFADGKVWSKPDIALAVSRVDDNSTTLIGTADIDVLEGGKGDDRLEGWGDTDIYRYRIGDGSDVIMDQEDNNFRQDNDMLQFLDGIRVSDLVFERDGDSNDLIIKFKDNTSDQIKIEGLFGATYTGVYGNWYQKRIELFTFDDGTSLSFDQLASLVLRTYSTSGDNELYGMNREDVLAAGKGNDYVSGGNESDIYLFNLGDGQDVFQDRVTNILSGTDDTMIFGTGIASTDIAFDRVEGDNNTLVLKIAGTDDSVTLLNQYASTYAFVYGALFFDRIETIRFTDEPGTVWTSEQIAQMAVDAAKTEGDDTVVGFDLDDVLDGGAGNDTMIGGDGNDTYLWGVGYGNDRIQEGGQDAMLGGDLDKVVFQGGLTADDVTVSRVGSTNDVMITIKTTGETLTLVGQLWYTSINYHPDQVDLFEFSDGTVWTAVDLRERFIKDSSSDGDDVIHGTFGSDVLDAGAGNDTLYGSDGSDTYIFGYGYGHDTIEEQTNNVMYSDDDKVVFASDVTRPDVSFTRIGNSADLLITLLSTGDTLTVRGEFYTGNFDMNDVEEFVFADGTIVTEDELRVMMLSSTPETDTIYGFDKSDTFFYNPGSGNVTFVDGVNTGTQDKMVLNGLVQSDVTIGRDLNDLIITVAPAKGGGSLRLTNSINDYIDQGIESIQFSDGVILTRTELRALLVSGSGTPGDDTITGTNSDDVIEGGLGNDTMDGGAGSDTYFYRRGDGNDTITENWTPTYAQDRLVLNDISSADVTFERSGSDLVLVIAESTPGAGDSGRITLVGNGDIFYDSGVERFIFDDGTIWTADDARTHYFSDVATAGADVIVGFNANDRIAGGAGNDTIDGGQGSDTYIYERGDGNDTITEGGYFSSAQDKLTLNGIVAADVIVENGGGHIVLVINESSPSAGNDGRLKLVHTGSPHYDSGIELVIFSDGETWNQDQMRSQYLLDARTDGADTITGFSTNDTITGGLGDDTLNGGPGGNDTYIYARGDGNDTITDTSGDADRLVFSDIDRDEVSFAKSGGDLIATVSSLSADGGVIVVKGFNTPGSGQGIESIAFANGDVLLKADLIAELANITGTSGNDTLTGTTGHDVFRGRGGLDTITGDLGNDTYLYARGDGDDTIIEIAGSYEDEIKFTDINAADITLSRNGNDLIIQIKETSIGSGDGGSITVKDNLNDYWGRGIDFIRFADNSRWTIAETRNKLLDGLGTSGNEVITGFDTNDTITGRGGDDTLNGDLGNDIYVYARGDGDDTIIEPAGSYNDEIQFTNVNATNVTLGQNGNDLIIHINETSAGSGDGGSITIKDNLNDYWGRGIDLVRFADNTQWTIAEIRNRLLDQVGTAVNDTITGFDTNDTIRGRGGNDSLNGGLGNDIYLYARGDGHDTIIEPEGSYSDEIRFTNINAANVTLSQSGNDLIINVTETSAVSGDGGSITIKDNLSDYWGRGIDVIRFADTTQWTITEIRGRLLDQAGTAGDDMVTGFNTNDTIRGRGGNDSLNGGLGNDTYLYARGDGHDTIIEPEGSYSDVLEFIDINAADVTLSQSGNDLIIQINESSAGNGDASSIVLKESVSDFWGRGIDFVRFENDTQWTIAEMRAML